MKESVTKFDLESAFKALDEIDVPVSEQGIKANKPALTEIFSRKSKFDALFEEYYDIGSTEELGEAKEEREAEIAKAKLARIEKIVDLDAESPEDLLTSYVGKYIIQCPQCMTLFYKDKEDVIESEDDPTNVNVGEACQHCGHESGYTLIGKVGEAEADEMEEPTLEAEMPAEPVAEEESTKDTAEEAAEEPAEEADDLDIALDAIDLEDESVEEDDKKEESFVTHEGEALVEEIKDDDLDTALEAHAEYIKYLRTMISQEEEALGNTDNEQVKAAIQRRLDAFKSDLEAALPSEVRDDLASEDLPSPEEVAEEPVEEADKQEESYIMAAGGTLTEELHEEAELEVSAEEFEKLIKEPEFKQPISDTAVRAMLNSEKASEEEVEESVESVALEEGVFDTIKNKISDAFDQLGRKLTARESKADWILAHAMKDYSLAKFNNKHELIPDESTKRFNTYIVICYKGTFSNGKIISQAPTHDNKNLIPVSSKVGETYKQADDTAKGWSMREGNGPAFIYLAKNAEGEDSLFLCQYFEGKLANDNIDKYFNIVKDDIKGAALEARGKMKANDATDTSVADDAVEPKEVKVSEIVAGMKLKFDKDIGEVLKIDASKFGAKYKQVTIKFSSGEQVVNLPIAGDVTALIAKATPGAGVATEALERSSNTIVIIEQLKGLQESSLEKLISDSLVEAYGNVAGYRLNGCEYLNEKLNVNGTIYFTSGNTRKTTYTFSEAYAEDGKITLKGLNEKLGLDKQFVLAGYVDEAKTLITESFSYNKK